MPANIFIEMYVVHSVLPMATNVYLWIYWFSFNHQSIYHGCVPFRIELEMPFEEDSELQFEFTCKGKKLHGLKFQEIIN